MISCEIDPRQADFAWRYFGMCPHGRKIEFRLGPARENLAALKSAASGAGSAGAFDLAFIDADKGTGSSPSYRPTLAILGGKDH